LAAAKAKAVAEIAAIRRPVIGEEPWADRVDAYMRDRVPGLCDELVIERASGGMSNPTYFLRAGDWSAVLRKQPDVSLSPSAHRIDREYRVICALADSVVPVPAPIFYCDDAAIIGTPFYVMERLEGRIFADASLPGVSAAERRACYQSMAETMATLHNVDWAAAGLSDFGRTGDYFARQISGWAAQWAQFGMTDNPAIDQLLAWLRENIPAGTTTAICHGDFRFANLMFHAHESRVVGLFDWELSTLGHPLADVAFNLQSWLLQPDDNGGVAGLDLEALGIPTLRAYLAHYYALAKNTERLSRFHIAFAMFRAAVGVSGVAMRAAATDGDTATPKRFAKAYANAGVSAIDAWDDD
jgi:aminoglycoside phosphotransferase (APT) family kinase protein